MNNAKAKPLFTCLLSFCLFAATAYGAESLERESAEALDSNAPIFSQLNATEKRAIARRIQSMTPEQRQAARERLENMTEEERQATRAELQSRIEERRQEFNQEEVL